MKRFLKGAWPLLCFILIPPAHAAAPRYEQSLKELSETLSFYQQLKKERVGYGAVLGRDPLRPLIDSNGNMLIPIGSEGSFALQGIVHSPNTNLVLVNDQFLAEGDQTGPYKILRIRPEGVTAKKEKERIFIPLHENA